MNKHMPKPNLDPFSPLFVDSPEEQHSRWCRTKMTKAEALAEAQYRFEKNSIIMGHKAASARFHDFMTAWKNERRRDGKGRGTAAGKGRN